MLLAEGGLQLLKIACQNCFAAFQTQASHAIIKAEEVWWKAGSAIV